MNRCSSRERCLSSCSVFIGCDLSSLKGSRFDHSRCVNTWTSVWCLQSCVWIQMCVFQVFWTAAEQISRMGRRFTTPSEESCRKCPLTVKTKMTSETSASRCSTLLNCKEKKSHTSQWPFRESSVCSICSCLTCCRSSGSPLPRQSRLSSLLLNPQTAVFNCNDVLSSGITCVLNREDLCFKQE